MMWLKVLEVRGVWAIYGDSQVSKHRSWRLITWLNNQSYCSFARDSCTRVQEIPRVSLERRLFTVAKTVVNPGTSVYRRSILILLSDSYNSEFRFTTTLITESQTAMKELWVHVVF